MKQLPSLKQLEYLVALADCKHFGKAAERCHVTPSTLSAGIHNLESLLGIKLAERSKRYVLMTSIGKTIAKRGQLLLRDAEDIMELPRTHHKPMTSEIKMGVIPTIAPFLLPRIMPSLNAQFNLMRMHLEEDLTDPLLDRLRLGEIDVALIAMPYNTKGFTAKILFEDKFVLACSQDNPLAQKKVVTVADLHQQPLMLLEEGHCLRAHALMVCKPEQGQQRSKFEASSFHTLVQMVASGLGVTLLPKLSIDAGVVRGLTISLVPLAEAESRKIGFVWRQSSIRAHEYEVLGDAVTKVISDNSG